MPNPCVQFVSIQFVYACMYKMTSHNIEQINICFLSTILMVMYAKVSNNPPTKSTNSFLCVFNLENQVL